MSAEDRLNLAIVASIAEGRTIPCGRWDDHTLWTSDAEADRVRAAELCGQCPAWTRESCLDLADDVRAVAGVWGGLDYGEPRNRRWRWPRMPIPPCLVCGLPVDLTGCHRHDADITASIAPEHHRMLLEVHRRSMAFLGRDALACTADDLRLLDDLLYQLANAAQGPGEPAMHPTTGQATR